jgi:uncharacterized membrane protein
MDIVKFITEQSLILIPVLYILGTLLKSTPNVQDWLIPYILLVLGIMGSILLMGFNIQAIIQGILVSGATVLGNQLIKQVTDKKE